MPGPRRVKLPRDLIKRIQNLHPELKRKIPLASIRFSRIPPAARCSTTSSPDIEAFESAESELFGNGRWAIWRQFDRSKSNIMLIDNF